MILVTGPTGNVGRALVPLLVQRDLDVRCLVHAGGTRLESGEVDVVEGDLDDTTSVAGALEGCDRLFLLSPPHPDQVRRECAVVDAAVRAGVRHVVALSVIGADRGSPSDLCRWHAAIDEHLAASGLAATVLRPTAFMQVHLSPPSAAADGHWYGCTGDGAHAFVDVADVAAAAAAVLQADEPPTGVLELTGPQALSMPEAAEVYGRALGREVTYVDLAPEQLAGAMTANGVPAFLAEAVVALYGTIRAGHLATVSHRVEELTGRAPAAYADVLARAV